MSSYNLTSENNAPAHNKCIFNFTQKQNNVIPFTFHNCSRYDSNLFFKKLVDMKQDKVKFFINPQTNKKYISVTYGCIRLTDNYRCLSSSFFSSVKTLVDNDDGTLQHFKERNVGVENICFTNHSRRDDIPKLLNEIQTVISKDRYDKDSIEDIKKDFPD